MQALYCLLICVFILGVCGQASPFMGCVPRALNTTCNYVGFNETDNIFVPYASQSLLLQNYSMFAPGITLALVINTECGRVLKELACKRVFRPCESSIAIPPTACRSQCENALEACKELFAFAPERAPNCTEKETLLGLQFDAYTPSPLPCNNRRVALADEDCIYPFIRDFNAKEGDPFCTIQCPFPRREDCTAYYWIEYIGMPLSFVLGLYATITLITNPDRRKFPLNLHIIAIVAASIVSTSPQLIVFILKREDMLCENNWTYRNKLKPQNFLCIFQAVVSYFGALSGLFYWGTLGIVMAISLYHYKIKWTNLMKFVCYVLPGLLALLLTTLAFGLQKFAALPSCIPFCYLSFLPEDSALLNVTTFFIMLACFSNLIAVSYISYAIYMSYRRLKTLNSEKEKKQRRFLRAQLGMWVYLMGVMVVTITVLCATITAAATSTESLSRNIAQWTTCVYQNGIDACGIFPSVNSEPMAVALQLALSATGIVAFVSAAAMPEFFTWSVRNWYYITCRLEEWEKNNSMKGSSRATNITNSNTNTQSGAPSMGNAAELITVPDTNTSSDLGRIDSLASSTKPQQSDSVNTAHKVE